MNSEPGACFLTCETMLSLDSQSPGVTTGQSHPCVHQPHCVSNTLGHFSLWLCGFLSVWEIWELNSDPL